MRRPSKQEILAYQAVSSDIKRGTKLSVAAQRQGLTSDRYFECEVRIQAWENRHLRDDYGKKVRRVLFSLIALYIAFVAFLFAANLLDVKVQDVVVPAIGSGKPGYQKRCEYFKFPVDRAILITPERETYEAALADKCP